MLQYDRIKLITPCFKDDLPLTLNHMLGCKRTRMTVTMIKTMAVVTDSEMSRGTTRVEDPVPMEEVVASLSARNGTKPVGDGVSV